MVNGVTMYNTIKAMPYEINTHNISNVDFIANVIFLAGKNRLANQCSTFMFHGVGFNGNNNERLEEKNILEKLNTIKSEHNRIAKIISDHSGLSVQSCMGLFKQQELDTLFGPSKTAWLPELTSLGSRTGTEVT